MRDICGRAFDFALRVVKLCQFLDQTPGVAKTLSKQLLRAGTAVGANLEEGQAAQSEADFLTKISIACKEARETHYWLRLLKAGGIVETNRTKDLEQEANELVAILSTICKKVKNKKRNQERRN